MKYDITFKDGTVQTAQVQRKVYYDLYYDGYYIGHCFDVDAGDETLTLFVCIDFDNETGTGLFETGQITGIL